MHPTFDIENNKLIARKFLELITKGKVEEMCEMISPAWRMHIGLGATSIHRGLEGMRKLFASFSNLEQEWTIEDVIAEGEKVVVHAINNCKQEIFLGAPSYGRPQTFTASGPSLC